MPIRCLIVDDNEAFLRAAQLLLEREGLVVIGVASTSDDAMREAETLHPDVVLVDIFLGEDNGLDLAQRLRDLYPRDGPAVILISTHSERDVAELMAATPAVGFLPKAELSATAVRTVLDGNGRGTR